MARKPIRVEKSSGSVFLDIGFDEAEAAELLAKAKLSLELQRAIRARGLTQKQAATLCGTDQPTLSKVLSGRMTSISMDQLTLWLNVLAARSRSRSSAPAARPRPLSSAPRAVMAVAPLWECDSDPCILMPSIGVLGSILVHTPTDIVSFVTACF